MNFLKTYLPGILLFSSKIVKPHVTKQAEVKEYPGSCPLTLANNVLLGGLVYLSVGSDNLSDASQPCAYKVIKSSVFFITSSLGGVLEKNPPEKNSGYYKKTNKTFRNLKFFRFRNLHQVIIDARMKI